MADVIHKYGPITPSMDWIVCKGDPVYVGLQHGEIYVWCREANIDALNIERIVILVATGEPYIGPYYGTVVLPSGMVWHIVELL